MNNIYLQENENLTIILMYMRYRNEGIEEFEKAVIVYNSEVADHYLTAISYVRKYAASESAIQYLNGSGVIHRH